MSEPLTTKQLAILGACKEGNAELTEISEYKGKINFSFQASDNDLTYLLNRGLVKAILQLTPGGEDVTNLRDEPEVAEE